MSISRLLLNVALVLIALVAIFTPKVYAQIAKDEPFCQIKVLSISESNEVSFEIQVANSPSFWIDFGDQSEDANIGTVMKLETLTVAHTYQKGIYFPQGWWQEGSASWYCKLDSPLYIDMSMLHLPQIVNQ